MGNSGLKKKIEKEVPEEEQNVKELVKTLIESFLKSDSNYGVITEIKTDLEYINNLVRDYIEREKLDVYTIKLENRILLTKTGEDFEKMYKIIKEKSLLQIRKNIIEIWDDAENQIFT